MRLGIATAVLGLFFVPISSLFLPAGGSLAGPRVVGLVLVAAGATSLATWIMAWIRTPHTSRDHDARVNVSLAALSLLVVFLIAESGANAVLVLRDWESPIREFRDRQTFASVPHKLSHPFLLMVNNPALDGVNELGFIDQDWPVEKPPGTVRIACLGASTTEDGYPERLNRELSRRLPQVRIEVLNFANGGWTTAQSLINLVLNVRHFSPDWIILHHAANDRRSWGRDRVRTDYSDSYRIMSTPRPRLDAFLIRYFNSYALTKYLYYRARGINAGLSVYQVIFRGSDVKGPSTDVDIGLFVGNVTEIIRVAQASGTSVLVTTQPYSLTNLRWNPYWVESMRAANDALRSVANDLALPLVDLDEAITGREESFRDPIHLVPSAVDIKVQAIADVLVPYLATNDR